MKKLFLITSLLLSLCAFAQEKTTIETDALKLVNILGEPMTEMMLQQLKAYIPEKNHKAFEAEVQKMMPDFFVLLSNVYIEEFTHGEIKELLAFYETPIGKKITSKSAVLADKGMKAGYQWGQNLQDVMAKYME
ncbi:MAG: DUF2059 domain-containing protein [Capnocytophaga sp.]|nr:DUF2059 domain-containing protein [Capnocytophaga sp.]